MRKTWKTILALVLAMALLASAALAQSDFGRYDEPVHVTFMGCDASVVPYDASNPAIKSATDNCYITGYLEYMNLEVERIVPEDGTALSALINTGMASGTLPDFLEVSRAMFFTMAENGVLQDLTEAYEGYAQKKEVQYIVENFPDRMKTGYYDGQWLGLPVGQNYSDAHVLWVRTDWLEKVNMDVPKTLDDVIAVARAFKEAGLGGEKGIPFGLTGYEGVPKYGDITSFVSGFGVTLNTWVEGEDGTWHYGDTDERVRDALLALQAMYAEGLIKTDFAVTDLLTEEVSNSQCGLFYGPEWFGVTCIQTNLNNDPEAQWTVALLPSLTGEHVAQYTKARPGSYLVATTNCDHPEALFMLAEFGLTMKYSMTEEESLRFNMDENGIQLNNLAVTRALIRPDEGLAKLQFILAGLESGAEYVDPMADADYQLVLGSMAGDRTKDGRRIVWLDSRSKIYGLGEEHPELFLIQYPGPTTETMALYEESINSALASAMMKVILGADISVYDEAVETWYRTGGQTITDEVNAYYAANK